MHQCCRDTVNTQWLVDGVSRRVPRYLKYKLTFKTNEKAVESQQTRKEFFNKTLLSENTVNPVYRGHSREPEM
jgi:hypothetical protein